MSPASPYLLRRIPGLFILLLIVLVSCKKDFKPKSSSPSKTAARGATGTTDLHMSSINFWDVLYYYAGYHGNTGTFSEANKQTGHQMLSDLAAKGIRSIRFFAAGSYCESCVNFPVVELWKNNRTAYYQAFDQLVSDAATLNIQLIPSLVTGFYDANEINQAAQCVDPTFLTGSISFMPSLTKNTGSGCQTYDCIVDPAHCSNRTGMMSYALDIVNRYSTSNTILFWELGNELSLMTNDRSSLLFVTPQQIADYVKELSQKIRAIDQTHLICAGLTNEPGTPANIQSKFNFYYSQLPNVDIATIHLYDGDASAFYSQPVANQLQLFNTWSTQNGKQLYIGEYGVAPGTSWTGNNYNNFVMSLLMAKTYLQIPLASAWTWESKNNGYYAAPNTHVEMLQFSIDPGEDDDVLSIINWNDLYMWNEDLQTSIPITGDFDADQHTDFGVMTRRGLFDVALMNNNNPSIPSQWINYFGDGQADPGGSPFLPLTGDWDDNGRTDIGLKSRDGRWFVAFSDPINHHFINQAQWLSGFGDDNADPGGAPFQPLTGDWDNNGRTDIGLKSRDGRWFVAFADPANNRFTNQAQWLSGFGDDNADPGGAPFQPLTGDWNGDGYTDIGLKSKDGRWFVAFADPLNHRFTNQAQWLANFGNDYTDPGGAPFQPLTGDWNGDGYTDIALKSRDGRWFVAFADPAHNRFSGQAQWITSFGDDNLDPGGAPFIPIAGDWNGDHLTDIGLKSRDGRWFTYLSTGTGFTAPRQLLP